MILFKDILNENVIINEWSKNDPIPEITHNVNEKLAIFLLGTPGGGKTTFSKNFILPRNPNFKTFSTDDISLLFTKDDTKYHEGSAVLNKKYIMQYIKTGENFIYDGSGANPELIFKLNSVARENGYKVIIIYLMAPLNMAKKQNLQRVRNVPEDYIEFAYNTAQENMHQYAREIKPDNLYIVLNIEGKYKFMKYENGKILKKKNDKYVPVH